MLKCYYKIHTPVSDQDYILSYFRTINHVCQSTIFTTSMLFLNNGINIGMPEGQAERLGEGDCMAYAS